MLYQCRTVAGDGMRVGKENTHMACKQSIPNSNERWGNFEERGGRKGWEGFLAVHGRAARYFNHLVSIIHVCQGACAARIESSAQQREMGCKTCSSFTGDVREPRSSPFYRRTKSENTQPIQPLAAFVAPALSTSETRPMGRRTFLARTGKPIHTHVPSALFSFQAVPSREASQTRAGWGGGESTLSRLSRVPLGEGLILHRTPDTQ